MTGFEPTTPWSQTKCSTKLSYIPLLSILSFYGAPGRSRTHNLLIRSQTLYPIELRALNILKKWCRGPESNRHGSHLPQDFKSCASASSATPAHLERKTRFELATPTLARWCSTTELLPHVHKIIYPGNYVIEINGAGEGSRTPTPCGARS